MRRNLLKSKIHRARVTGADLHYHGSLTLDPDLMEAADIVPFERVEIYNISNGSRFATYAIEGERGAGEVVANGAAARLVSRDDLVIVCTYVDVEDAACRGWQPRVVFVDEKNRPVPAGG